MSEVVVTKPEQGNKKYHRPSRGMAEKTAPERRERLDSAEVAEENDCRPCGICRRSEYKEWRKQRRSEWRSERASEQKRQEGEDEPPHERGLWCPKYVSQGGDNHHRRR